MIIAALLFLISGIVVLYLQLSTILDIVKTNKFTKGHILFISLTIVWILAAIGVIYVMPQV